MCNFNKQNEETKLFISLFMKKAAQNVGGENFLLSLIEAMKLKKPNPLMIKECQIASNNTIIKWNKKVFKDKITILEEIIFSHKSLENTNFNILENENAKKRKNILNMVKTLSPIEFFVTPQNPNDGSGFSFKLFDTISNDYVQLNPIFVAMFFCGTEFTKKSFRFTI